MLTSEGVTCQFEPVSRLKGTHRAIFAAKRKPKRRPDPRLGGRRAKSPTDKAFRHTARRETYSGALANCKAGPALRAFLKTRPTQD